MSVFVDDTAEKISRHSACPSHNGLSQVNEEIEALNETDQSIVKDDVKSLEIDDENDLPQYDSMGGSFKGGDEQNGTNLIELSEVKNEGQANVEIDIGEPTQEEEPEE